MKPETPPCRARSTIRSAGFPAGMSILIASAAFLTSNCPAADRPASVLRYDKPAARWEQEALPIGNAFMGAMIFGGTDEERIQFNEESLWIGDEEDTGAYQAFGDVFVRLGNGKVPVTGYQRELDISRAVHTVTYEADGVKFRREAFASYPAHVMVFRFSADKPGALTGEISLTDMHKAAVSAAGPRITSAGSLAGYQFKKSTKPYSVILSYEAQLGVAHDGGKIETAGDKIVFTGADSVTLYLSAGTDFMQDRAKGWKGEPPHAKVTARLDVAMKRRWDDLLSEHVRDYQSLFNRVSIDLAPGRDPSAPTDARLAGLKKPGAEDHGMEALLFQYGRYLMISSSRPGSLPANLQGKWNVSNNPPWRCDYHTDINVQMNYWPVDVADLSECFEPYARWIGSIRSVRTDSTRKTFNKSGWLIHGESGLFGGSTWDWVPGASAWLLQNSYDHYRFTGDKAYLRDYAYPAMKEVCAYWMESLVQEPDGTFVTPVGLSPEQGPKEKGITFDREWVWDLFNSTIEASEALGVDDGLRARLKEMKAKLAPLRIGRWGQLQEWLVDRDDPKNTHRHLSHLIALYPGRQISPARTPDLAEAARVSLNARGDASTGWSTANKIGMWARLHDGDHAYKLVTLLLTRCILPNLFDSCPPFQIDGNFGYTAGVCEMLVQSHLDGIELLPALPKAWPDGRVTGLRARGGFTVDIAWKNGALSQCSLSNPNGGTANVTCGGKSLRVALKPGVTVTLDGNLRASPAR